MFNVECFHSWNGRTNKSCKIWNPKYEFPITKHEHGKVPTIFLPYGYLQLLKDSWRMPIFHMASCTNSESLEWLFWNWTMNECFCAGVGATQWPDPSLLEGWVWINKVHLVSSWQYYFVVRDSKLSMFLPTDVVFQTLQQGTLSVPLESGVTRKLHATLQSVVRRPCNSWRVGWRWKNTSFCERTSAKAAASVLVSKSTSILESSKSSCLTSSLLLGLWNSWLHYTSEGGKLEPLEH